jgi:fumarate reductase flavoprotein subunit
MSGHPVIVVGGGFAGLAAANVAAAAGHEVLLLEKGADRFYACNSRIATGVLGLAHSDPTDPPERLYAAIMDDTEGYADPALARLMAESAGTALRWLSAENVKVMKAMTANKIRWVLAPPKLAKPGHDWQGRGPDVALHKLADNLTKRGGRIRYATRARHLLMQDGACVGVEAESNEGVTRIDACAVVLADGGFQGDAALLKRFIGPSPERIAQRNAETGCGDALRMAEAIGAQLTDTSAFYGHLLAREALTNRELWPYPTLDTLASGAMIVNSEGVRFVDEGLGGIPLSNVIARLDDPLSATTIFDDIIWNAAGKAEFIAPNPYVHTLGGTVTTANSIEELASALGIDSLRLSETVNAYNRAIEGGDLARLQPPRTAGRSFGESRSSAARQPVRPILTPPFHAIRLCAGLSYTLGGIAIDAHCRVLNCDGDVVPGLFAAGGCVGGIEGGPIAGYIGGLLKAVCTGLRAGELTPQCG